MKYVLLIVLVALVSLSVSLSASAQKKDTLRVQGADLNIKGLQTGDYSYLIIRQKSLDSPVAVVIGPHRHSRQLPRAPAPAASRPPAAS